MAINKVVAARPEYAPIDPAIKQLLDDQQTVITVLITRRNGADLVKSKPGAGYAESDIKILGGLQKGYIVTQRQNTGDPYQLVIGNKVNTPLVELVITEEDYEFINGELMDQKFQTNSLLITMSVDSLAPYWEVGANFKRSHKLNVHSFMAYEDANPPTTPSEAPVDNKRQNAAAAAGVTEAPKPQRTRRPRATQPAA